MEFIMRIPKDGAQYHVDTLIYSTAWGGHQLYAFNYGAAPSAAVASDRPARFAGAMTFWEATQTLQQLYGAAASLQWQHLGLGR